MGIELIKKAGDQFQRKQRKSLNSLEEAHLFTSLPQVTYAVTAVPMDGHIFQPNDWLRLALVNNRLVVIDGITTVGEVVDPPSSVVDRMRTVSPSLPATLKRVFSLTGKAELLLEFA